MEGLCWREDVLDWFLLEVVVVDAVEDDVNDVRQEILQNQHVCVTKHFKSKNSFLV